MAKPRTKRNFSTNPASSALNQRKVKNLALEMQIIEMYKRKGMTMERIAHELGMRNRKIVWYYIERAKKRWIESINKDVAEIKAEVKESLDWLLYELIAAWEKSKEAKKKSVVRARNIQQAAPGTQGTPPAAQPQSVDKSTATEEREPNAAYAALILQTLDRMIRLFGLEAATKFEQSGPGGGPLQIAMNMDDNALDLRIQALLAPAAPGDRALVSALGKMRSAPEPIDIPSDAANAH